MSSRPLPAFTLIEMLVGASMALLIAGSAMGVLLSVQQVQRDAQSRNAIARDSQFAVEHLGYDLQYLGVGVPRGTSLDAVAGELRPAVRVGTATYLAFVGDLPYPNAELNGIAVLNHIKGATTPPDSGDDDELIVTSELSPCAPEASGAAWYSCPQHLMSALPIDAAAGDKCVEGTTDARLCPWGLGKWQRDGGGSVSLVFMGPRGQWTHRRWAMGAGNGAGGWTSIGQAAGPHLDSHDDIDRGPLVSNSSGVGAVAQLDRVFYSLEATDGGACLNTGAVGTNCVLMRRQCWGALGDPGDAAFPAVGAGVIRSDADPANCDFPGDGTPWETVVNGIDQMTFRYFRRPGEELFGPLDATDAAQVQYIEAELTISRLLAGSPVVQTQRMTRRYYLESSGGFEGAGAGSCADTDPWCGRP